MVEFTGIKRSGDMKHQNEQLEELSLCLCVLPQKYSTFQGIALEVEVVCEIMRWD